MTIWDFGFQISNFEFRISNFKSEIRNPKSPIDFECALFRPFRNEMARAGCAEYKSAAGSSAGIDNDVTSK